MCNLPAHRVGEVARCEHIEFPFSRAICIETVLPPGTLLYLERFCIAIGNHWNCIKDRFDRFDLLA